MFKSGKVCTKFKIRDWLSHKKVSVLGIDYTSLKIGTCCHNDGLGCYVTGSRRQRDGTSIGRFVTKKLRTLCHWDHPGTLKQLSTFLPPEKEISARFHRR
jgi:hypothetical protein